MPTSFTYLGFVLGAFATRSFFITCPSDNVLTAHLNERLTTTTLFGVPEFTGLAGIEPVELYHPAVTGQSTLVDLLHVRFDQSTILKS
jgi:hypothetical protein